MTVPPQIRVWGILFCCYLLSADRWTFACGDLTGILYLHSHKDYTSTSFDIHFVICQYLSGSVVLCQFCLPWTLLQEAFPLKHFWQWTIASLWCTIWSIVTCRTLGLDFFHTVFKSFISRRLSLCITKQGVRAFVFDFWSFFLTQKSSWIALLNTEEGRVNGLDYTPNAMDSPTFSSTSCSSCFGDLHASTSSYIVMSVYHDVYTGGGLLHFASCATFPITEIHTWFPSHRSPFRHERGPSGILTGNTLRVEIPRNMGRKSRDSQRTRRRITVNEGIQQ